MAGGSATSREGGSTGTCRFRVGARIPLAGGITEKEACISLPNVGGKIDYSVYFASEDEQFPGWCEDLVDYLWNQGKYLK